MKLAKIENNVVVNIAKFDPDNIPEWASDWVDATNLIIGMQEQDDGSFIRVDTNVDVVALAKSVRQERDDLLKESDWTQVSDAPVDQNAWAVYRQALRDISLQETFPEEVIWPEKP